MKYLFESLEVAQEAESIISNNMGYTLPNRYAIPILINNPNHEDYNKAYFHEVEGDPAHHELWMTGVDGIIDYEIVQWDSTWQLSEEY